MRPGSSEARGWPRRGRASEIFWNLGLAEAIASDNKICLGRGQPRPRPRKSLGLAFSTFVSCLASNWNNKIRKRGRGANVFNWGFHFKCAALEHGRGISDVCLPTSSVDFTVSFGDLLRLIINMVHTTKIFKKRLFQLKQSKK